MTDAERIVELERICEEHEAVGKRLLGELAKANGRTEGALEMVRELVALMEKRWENPLMKWGG